MAQCDSPKTSHFEFASHLLSGARLLQAAAWYARSERLPTWEFAVEMNALLECGFTHHDLRVLLNEKLLIHGQEQFSNRSTHRRFRRLNGLSLPHQCCFILSELGEAVITQYLEGRRDYHLGNTSRRADKHMPLTEKPRWNAQRRELIFRGMLVKRLRVPAANQELVLAAFQEESWPHRLDNPLPGKSESTAQERLRDTIHRLNGGHTFPAIRFRGDGKGFGIIWEVLEQAMGHT